MIRARGELPIAATRPQAGESSPCWSSTKAQKALPYIHNSLHYTVLSLDCCPTNDCPTGQLYIANNFAAGYPQGPSLRLARRKTIADSYQWGLPSTTPLSDLLLLPESIVNNSQPSLLKSHQSLATSNHYPAPGIQSRVAHAHASQMTLMRSEKRPF